MTSAVDLRDRLRFEARGATDDGYGNTVTGAYAAQFTRAAELKPLRGGEQVVADRLQGSQPMMIRVRYDAQTAAISTDWRAVDVRAGTVYQIKTATDPDRKRQWIEMMAVAGVAG